MTDQELIRIINGIPDENQLKLHVLLMLNCAYRGMDIATLKDSEIQDGRIIRKRHKTKDQKNMPYQHTELYSLEELKKIYNEFNNSNYLKYLNNPDELDKYYNNVNSNYSSLYLKMWNSVTLTEEFKNNYEKFV